MKWSRGAADVAGRAVRARESVDTVPCKAQAGVGNRAVTESAARGDPSAEATAQGPLLMDDTHRQLVFGEHSAYAVIYTVRNKRESKVKEVSVTFRPVTICGGCESSAGP